MTYDEWKAALESNEASMKAAGLVASSYPRGPMGLTLEASKDARWREAMRTIGACRTRNMRLHRQYKAYSKRALAESRQALAEKRAAIQNKSLTAE